MYRTLTKILVSLALALGLSLVAGTAASQAATTTTASSTAANPCTTQHNRVNHAKKAVKKAKKALKKAKHTHKAAKIKKAKKRLAKAKKSLRNAQKALKRCQSSTSGGGTGGTGGGTGGGTTPGAPSLQALCDAGVPQTVCDTLAQLTGSLSPSSLPLDQFCTSVPQAADLCNALKGGADASTLTNLVTTLLNTLGLGSSAPSLQSLCDAGVPQAVCDGLAQYAGSLSPSSLPLDQFCTSVPQAADLCSALKGGADPSTLTSLLTNLLTTLGLGNLIGTLPTSIPTP
ncbi:hypothetical protein GCM10028801_17620 [Nocardioides maradonensis]